MSRFLWLTVYTQGQAFALKKYCSILFYGLLNFQ